MKIDKLSLTLSGYMEQQKKAMLGAALQFMDGSWGQQVYPRNGYKLNIMVSLKSTTERALFSWNPVAKDKPYFRVEFNPSKMGPAGIEELIHHEIEVLLNFGVQEFDDRAKVSRIDVAVDLIGADIRDLVVFSDCAVRSAKFDRYGLLETLYLGSPASQARTKIYDKVAEMVAGGLMPASPHPVTRVERTVCNGPFLKNLAKMKNPFSSLQLVLQADKPGGIPAHLWAMFLSHAEKHTAQAALAQLPKVERTKFKKAIKSVKPVWWDSADIWKLWPDLVGQLGLTLGTRGSKLS